MINANKDFLTSFFQSNIQYIIPFFQRPYVWSEENWEILWDNVQKIHEDYKNEIKSEHFIGTLITKQRTAEILGQNQYDVIDGQQRLTTITILLKAIADSCKGVLPKLKEKLHELILFEDAKGLKHLRIKHNRLDTPYFEALLFDKSREDLIENHKIFKAHNYFYNKVSKYSDEKLNELKELILHKIPVISMLLSQDDDEQVIFDTINSLGVKLTTAELLKNFIFKEKPLQDMYDDYWLSVFEQDEEQIEFWNKNKTSGRIIRTNIEILLYCFLIINTQSEVKLETLFKEYKKWLKDKSPDDKIKFLIELKEYAGIYYQFPEGEELNEFSYDENIKMFFHIIENLSVTTVYPLILFLFKNIESEKINEYIKYLESYIIRRNVCRLTTKNYNNLFISIMQKLIDISKHKKFELSDFVEILNDFKEETNVFPDDISFKKGFHTSYLSNQNSREILYCIALFQKNDGLSDVKKLSSSSFSVEHMMPKVWETHWNIPKLSESEKITRNMKLLTLGNLTLITKKLNSKLKNAPWQEKRNTLRAYSSLKITTEYLVKDTWNETSIQERADDLYMHAQKMWMKK